MQANAGLDSIDQITILTKDQEFITSLAAFNGCQRSKKSLILHLLQILIKSLRSYRLGSELYHDCLSEGTIAIIKAIEIFNPYRGFSISSYVSWFIHSAIRTTIRKHNSLISIPKNRWYQEKSKQKMSGRSATTDSTLYKTQLPQANLFSDIELQPNGISSDPRGTDPADIAEHSYLQEVVRQGLDQLSDFEKQIISEKYGFDGKNGISSRKMAQKFNCSRATILKAEESAQRSLRIFFKNKGLYSFVQGG